MTNVHISAFNSDKYMELLQPMYPDITFTNGFSRDDLGEGIEACDIIIAFGLMLNDEVFEKNKNIKWIQTLGTGVDGAADRKGLRADTILTSMRGIHGPQMSEMAFMMMLNLNRNYQKILANQQNHKWDRWPPMILDRKTVGIAGVGLIAELLAARCKAFGMTVVGITGTARKLENFDDMRSRDDIAGAVRDLDYLIVLAPYTRSNDKLINAEVFAAMKPTAYLINLARGGVVDEAAMIEALRNKSIAGAGLDVFDQEPLPASSPFWEMENVVLTPHMGGMSESYVAQAMPVIETNMRAWLDGRYDDMVNKLER